MSAPARLGHPAARLTGPGPTWAELVAIEPRLGQLREELFARREKLAGNWREYDLFKRRLLDLVGWGTLRTDVPEWFRGNVAYDRAFDATLAEIW